MNTRLTANDHPWLDQQNESRKCPKCHQHHLDTRVPRGFFVKHFLFWKPYKRYRCFNCQATVYILTT